MKIKPSTLDFNLINSVLYAGKTLFSKVFQLNVGKNPRFMLGEPLFSTRVSPVTFTVRFIARHLSTAPFHLFSIFFGENEAILGPWRQHST